MAPRCLTAAPLLVRSDLAARAAVVFVSQEERRPLASGRKLVVVRGGMPSSRIEELSRTLESAYRRIVGDLGYPGFPDRIVLSLADLEPRAQGQARVALDGASAEITLSRSLAESDLSRALVHQIAHLATAAWPRGGAGWWEEATASWLAAGVLGEMAVSDQAIRARLQQPGEPLLGGGAGSTSELWPAFLELRFRTEVVRRIWEQLAAAPDMGVQRAMETVIEAHGSTLRRELEAFAGWLVAEAGRRDLLGGTVLADPGSEDFPLRRELAPIPAFGMTFLRLDLGSLAGGLRLELGADSRAEWTATALIFPPGSSVPTARASLASDSAGRLRLAVPASGAGSVVLAVLPLGQGPLSVTLGAQVDERFPYVLSLFEASVEGEAVRLFWSTSSESELGGWWVKRSGSPVEPFERLLGTPLPAARSLAAGEEGSDYAVLDSGVEAGKTYYYILEALTADGLPASSQMIAVSLPR